MEIKTKYDIKDEVYIIHNDKIIKRFVYAINIRNKYITYDILISKAPTSLDKDNIILKDEDNCFRTIEEMIKYYENENR